MKQPVFYDNAFLQIRPETVAVTLNCEPAAKLMSVLLFHYNGRVITSEHAENLNERSRRRSQPANQDTSPRIPLKQEQIIRSSANLLTKKTIIGVATPMLQLLGFIEVDDRDPVISYILDIDRFQDALDANHRGRLDQWIKDKVRLDNLSDDLQKFLANNKKIATLINNCKQAKSEEEAGNNCKSPGNNCKPPNLQLLLASLQLLLEQMTAHDAPRAAGSTQNRSPKNNKNNKNNKNLLPEGSDQEDPQQGDEQPLAEENEKKHFSSVGQAFYLLWVKVLGTSATKTIGLRWNPNVEALETMATKIITEERLRTFIAFVREKDARKGFFKVNVMHPCYLVQPWYLDEWLAIQEQASNLAAATGDSDERVRELRQAGEESRKFWQEQEQKGTTQPLPSERWKAYQEEKRRREREKEQEQQQSA